MSIKGAEVLMNFSSLYSAYKTLADAKEQYQAAEDKDPDILEQAINIAVKKMESILYK